MNCQNCRDYLIDDEIAPETARHLENCPDCRRFAAQQTNLRRILSDLPAVTAPADFNFRVKARLREPHTNAPKSALLWRPLLWLAPTCAAVLIAVFVVQNNFTTAPPTESVQNAAPTIETPKIAPDEKPFIAAKPEQTQNTAPPLEKAAQSVPPKATRRPPEIVAPRPQLAKSKPQREKLRSVDLGVNAAGNSIMPRGIPDLINQKNDNAANIMRFFGVESRLENQVLRVVSVADQTRAAGLQKDDIIEKINDQSPATIKNESPQNINLIVRRQNQSIKLVINNQKSND